MKLFTLPACLRKFRKDERGTMTMEFAIIAPLLFTVLIAGFEFFDAFKSYSRAAKTTYTIADIISRQDEIDDTYIHDLHKLMDALMPWLNEDKVLRVTSITYSAADGYEVAWSKHSDKTFSMDTSLSLDASSMLSFQYSSILPVVADGDSIILVETEVPHRTLISMFGLHDLVWKNEIAIRPRFASTINDVTVSAGS